MNFDDWSANRSDYNSCPACMTPIEKIEGCNHVECGSCHAHFCWICKADITKEQYAHFNRDNTQVLFIWQIMD